VLAKSGRHLIQDKAPAGCFALQPSPALFRLRQGVFAALEAAMAVNFALSAARARVRSARRDARTEIRQAAGSWRERRENDLRQMGIVIPLSDRIGHNNGPDILESLLFVERQWRTAQAEAFAPPDAETGARWARKAEELGLSYREYRLELLERGRHPTEEDASRIRANRPLPARAHG
jgi:hypothetical protein